MCRLSGRSLTEAEAEQVAQLLLEEQQERRYWATRGDGGDEEEQDVTVSMSESESEAASSVHLQPPAAEPHTWPPSPTMSTEGPLTPATPPPPHATHGALAASPVAPVTPAPVTPHPIPPPPSPPAEHMDDEAGGSRQRSARSSSSSSSVEAEGEALDLSGYDGHVDLLRLMTEGARVTSGLRRALLACSTRIASPHASLQW